LDAVCRINKIKHKKTNFEKDYLKNIPQLLKQSCFHWLKISNNES